MNFRFAKFCWPIFYHPVLGCNSQTTVAPSSPGIGGTTRATRGPGNPANVRWTEEVARRTWPQRAANTTAGGGGGDVREGECVCGAVSSNASTVRTVSGVNVAQNEFRWQVCKS
jgi:hypothetical protein